MFVNLTPHPISVADANGKIVLTVGNDGTVARVSAVTAETRTVGGIAVGVQTFGEANDLPEQTANDVYYVVSGMVLAALAAKGCQRADVVGPRTDSTALRNAQGHVVAVRGFVGLV